MLGYSSNELLGKPVIDYIIQEDQERYLNFSNYSDLKNREAYELQWVAKNGDIISTLISPKYIFDKEGAVIGSFAVITDITKRIESEHLLRVKQVELMQQKDELESFAATIAHDLRGKLQTISLFNTIEEHEYSDKISDSIDDISTFIEDLLLLARKGSILGDIEKIDLNAIISELVKEIFQFKEETEVIIDELPIIKGDKLKLRQVFENILLNITKHTKASEISITSRKENGKYLIIFTDNGKGIPKKKLIQIKQSLKNQTYTSFGLAIIKKVVEAHNGSFDIRSKEREGTKVTISLPIRNLPNSSKQT